MRAYVSHWWSHRIVRAAALLTGLATLGTAGYMVIERWPFTDALFMTVIILSTVGLGEPHPLSQGGRAFTVALIVTGVTIAAYLVTALGEYVTGGVLTGVFRSRRLQRAIAQLSDHYIVCGYGRVGRQVVADLRRRSVSVVIVERHPATADEAQGPYVVTGDATEDDVLTRAGVKRARGLVAATGTDATNLVVTLSARALNGRLVIVARASDAAVEPKLTRAGATHVISPHAIGGQRIMSELLSPGITAFLDTVMHAEQLDLWLEVATVGPTSVLAGQTLGDALPPSRRALNLVALRRAADGVLVTNPPLEARLAAGDTLVALGPPAAVQHLAARALGAMRRSTRPSGPKRTRKSERPR
jgi:voltage-gated potassium channel